MPRVTEPSAELGVKQSPVLDDRLIVNKNYSDESQQPTDPLASLNPSDTITIGSETITVYSVCRDVEKHTKTLIEIGIPPNTFGTVATLIVERDPYLLDVCNGGIYKVLPRDVTVF